MRLEVFSLADAANRGEDGKINVLGMGARIVNYERLPGMSPLVIVAAVAATVDEAGEYPVELAIVEPDGTREVLASAIGKVVGPDEVDDRRVPTGIGLTVGMVRPFRIEGVHTLELRVGELVETYPFLVRIAQPKPRSSAPQPAP